MNQVEKQSQIAMAGNFFNLLYGKITALQFAYLWTKQRGIFSFNISDETQRADMAIKAVELSDNGVDVWHSVNPVCVQPTDGKRGDETVVSYQIACVVDIDISSNAHKSDNLATSFEEAKSFLPFTPSIIIHSGYGLHAYYIFDTPIAITDQNREQLKRRNNLLLDIIRLRANGKKIDGVGDLPRIMRTPSTFNYKLGTDNPPLCHIVEDSGLRFTPDELDTKLGEMIPAETKKAQSTITTTTKSAQTFNEDFSDDRDFNIFRVRRMLDFIVPSSLTYDEWLAVGMALKNSGCDCSDWENWSRADDRFKDGECESKWNGFNRDGYDIGTLYHFAEPNGYDAQEIFREWQELYSTQRKISTKKNTDDDPNSKMASLKAKLLEINKALTDSDTEKDKALENLRMVTVFDSDTVFSDIIVTAGAFARLFDKQAYSNFKREIKLFGDKNRDKKATVNDWVAVVRDKADLISSRRSELSVQRNEILAQIKSLSFVADDDTLAGIVFPTEYSISADGIEKIAGESMTTICRRPVIITSKSFDVEEKNYKLTLAYMTTAGKWKKLPATEAASIFDKNKLIVLSNKGLPVTSVNALNLVDYL
ncbi:MAG: PriCT-2 domain-containing protein, partial [Selenomonadaceae bacterium]|nr:PriCT-2 domain-containing protein [Selenomonadaceae bacterium]